MKKHYLHLCVVLTTLLILHSCSEEIEVPDFSQAKTLEAALKLPEAVKYLEDLDILLNDEDASFRSKVEEKRIIIDHLLVLVNEHCVEGVSERELYEGMFKQHSQKGKGEREAKIERASMTGFSCRKQTVESYGFNEAIYNRLLIEVLYNPPYSNMEGGGVMPGYGLFNSPSGIYFEKTDEILKQMRFWNMNADYSVYASSPVLEMYEREAFMSNAHGDITTTTYELAEVLVYGRSMWGFIIESTVLAISLKSLNRFGCSQEPELLGQNEAIANEVLWRNSRLGLIVKKALYMGGSSLSIDQELEFGHFVLHDMKMRMWEYMYELLTILDGIDNGCNWYRGQELFYDYHFTDLRREFPFSWDETCRSGEGGGGEYPKEPVEPSKPDKPKVDDLIRNNLLPERGRLRLEKIYEDMLDDCVFQAVDDELRSNGVMFNKVELDPVSFGNAGMSSKNDLIFRDTGEITLHNLKHETLHLFQHKVMEVDLFDRSETTGMAEFEVWLFLDLQYYVEIGGDIHASGEINHDWAISPYETLDGETVGSKNAYVQWLDKLTDKGRRFPLESEMKDADFRKLSVVFGRENLGLEGLGYSFGSSSFSPKVLKFLLSSIENKCF